MFKKIILTLLACPLLSVQAFAQTPANDTIAISDEEAALRNVQQEKIDSLTHALDELKEQVTDVKEDNRNSRVWNRAKYRNIAFTKQTMQLTDLNDLQWKSDYGFALTMGKTYYLHRKPILGLIKIGIDWTYFDLNFAQYSEDFGGDYAFVESNDPNNEYMAKRSDLECMQAEFSMHVGPSITVNPIDHLKVNAYFRYAPTASALVMNKEGSFSYASNFVAGAAISYKLISFGIEARWGEAKYNKMALEDDHIFSNVEGTPAFNDVIDRSSQKFKTSSTRFYISFRF